jgi:hypothetical protein
MPEEFTHLWLVAAASLGDRALLWTPDEGWIDVTTRWTTD